MDGIDCVVHCAALVHQMSPDLPDEYTAYRKVNVDATLSLAESAADAGVSRFIFMSTVKVLGEHTVPGHPFACDDTQAPEGSYPQSKYEAEKRLGKLVLGKPMDLVIIRPPLVYGPGVGANFAALITAVKKHLPLPLGAIRNRRSFVSVFNLADLVVACVKHRKPIGKALLVSDGEDVSTPDLIRRVGKAIGVRPLLVPVPVSWLKVSATLFGKRSAYERLCGNLQVDLTATAETLHWSPPYTMDYTLERMMPPSD